MCPPGFDVPGTSVSLIAFPWLASAQVATPEPPRVEVRLEMSWPTAPGSPHPQTAWVRLDPLDRPGPALTLRVSESSTTILRLPSGRYQLTTTTPLTYNQQAYGWSIELPLVSPVNHVRLSQENAVRLARDNGLEPAITAASAALNSHSADTLEDDADARAQIMSLLNIWITSLKSRSLKMQMACYAPRLVNYLQQGSLTRKQVEMQKQKMLRLYTQIRRLQLSNVVISVQGSEAVATVIKSWDFSNNEIDWRGRTLVDLGLSKINSGWMITSEQESAVPAQPRSTQPRLAALPAPPER